MNAEYIEALSDDEFLRRGQPFLPGSGQDAGVRVLAPDLKTRVKRLKEVCEQVEFLYQGKIELDVDAVRPGRRVADAAEALLAAEAALDACPSFSRDGRSKRRWKPSSEQHGWKPRPVLRCRSASAISGKTQHAAAFPMLAALGRERSLARLRDAIAQLEHA